MCASKALCAIEKAVWERIKGLSSGHLNRLSWAFELSSALEKERETHRDKNILGFRMHIKALDVHG